MENKVKQIVEWKNDLINATKEWYEKERPLKMYVYYDEEGDDAFIHSTQLLMDEIKKKTPLIKTTNTYALTFDAYGWGYDLYLVRHGVEMKLYPYMDCPSTDKEIRFGHNIERLVRANVVDTIKK